MIDMKDFGMICQTMQSDLDGAQKMLSEYYAQHMDSIMRVNIEAVISIPLPVNLEQCIKTLLENNITLMNLYQTRSIKLPSQIYIIFQNGIPARFFEIKFENINMTCGSESTIFFHPHPKSTIEELKICDLEPIQKEPEIKDHSFKAVKKRTKFFSRR